MHICHKRRLSRLPAIITSMDQANASREVLHKSQKEVFPYDFSFRGLTIQVNKGVFSPKHFNGWRIFTDNFPPVEGMDVLEIGTGTGITALYLAKNGAHTVVASDINPDAVENAKINAKRNGLKNIDIRLGDTFSVVGDGEVFDVIYWNMPFMPAKDTYKHASMLERGLFDPGYKILDRFLREANRYLKEDGRVIIGTGEGAFADIAVFTTLLKKHGYTESLLVREQSEEVNPVFFRLYELRSRNQ